jgi:plasmid maintenance system antidote protein VapI
MAEESGLLTAGALAERLGVSPGAVKKLIEAQKIQPDEVKKGCKYYGPAALKKLQAAAGKK